MMDSILDLITTNALLQIIPRIIVALFNIYIYLHPFIILPTISVIK